MCGRVYLTIVAARAISVKVIFATVFAFAVLNISSILRRMILLAHIAIALASLAWTTYLYFRPSQKGLAVSYGLVAATLASGTYLVVATHSPLLSSCITGLLYLAVVAGGIALSARKLARAKQPL